MIVHPQRHLNNLLKNFSTAMMITRSGDRLMHGQPMSIAEIGGDGRLCFATSLDSGKLRDIELDPEGTLIFQGDSANI
jgi:general stress protein 26